MIAWCWVHFFIDRRNGVCVIPEVGDLINVQGGVIAFSPTALFPKIDGYNVVIGKPIFIWVFSRYDELPSGYFSIPLYNVSGGFQSVMTMALDEIEENIKIESGKRVCS